MCDSSGTNDPTTYDAPRRRVCERLIWTRGEQRACGMAFGVTTWQDATGAGHTACRHHIAEVQYRYRPVESWAGA